MSGDKNILKVTHLTDEVRAKVVDTNVEEVVKAMRERVAKGYSKYGVTTERDDLTTMEWLQHLQEELMDGCVYIEKLKNDLHKKELEM